MSRVPLSEREKSAYKAIVAAANAGRTCPQNDVIAAIVGTTSTGTASEVVSRLARKGWIIIHRGQSSRLVQITDTGKFTAGEIPKPHWRDKGKPRPVIIVPDAEQHKPRRTQSEIREEAPAPVDREPCFKCGVRADVGCRHQVLA